MSKIEESLTAIDFSPKADLDIQHIEYDPTGMPNSANAERRAQLEGLTVIYPDNNQLFIDLDNEHSYQMFLRLFQIFQKFISEDSEFDESPSKSGLPKRHITVWSYDRTYTEIERVMFQAFLGSDRVREILGYVQAVNGDPHPTLFLEDDKPKQLPAGEVKGLLGTGQELQMQYDHSTENENLLYKNHE